MSNVLNMVSEQTFEVQTNKIASAISNAGGGTVDTEMSDSSTNAVQNKVIKGYVDDNTVTVDSAMSDSSENAVQNKVIKAYVDAQSGGTVDIAMSSSSENAVQNKVIKAYVDEKTETHLTVIGVIDLQAGTVTVSGAQAIYTAIAAGKTVSIKVTVSEGNELVAQVLFMNRVIDGESVNIVAGIAVYTGGETVSLLFGGNEGGSSLIFNLQTGA